MSRTPAENTKRMEIIGRAVHDVAEHLASQGHALTPAQVQEAIPRLGAVIAEVHAHVETEALDLVMCAAAMEFFAEMLGISAAPVDPIALGLELAQVASEEANGRITAGEYPEFTPAQRTQLITAVRRKVQVLVQDGITPEACREKIREFSRLAVDLVLGPAPARQRMN